MLGWGIFVLVVSEDYLGLTSFFRKGLLLEMNEHISGGGLGSTFHVDA